MNAKRLAELPLFEGLDDSALSTLARTVQEVSVSEDSVLVREGDYSYDLIAIEEGSAKVHHGDETVAELGPGDVVGEMGVLERAQRNASVTATSPMLLVTLTGWDVRKLRKQAPAAVEALENVVRERSAG